jgi:hypothetical protein
MWSIGHRNLEAWNYDMFGIEESVAVPTVCRHKEIKSIAQISLWLYLIK